MEERRALEIVLDEKILCEQMEITKVGLRFY